MKIWKPKHSGRCRCGIWNVLFERCGAWGWFFEEIDCLAPFGAGNTEPKFVIENIKVISSKIVGNDHIKSILGGKDGSVFKSFAWNGKNSPLETFLNIKNKKKISIAGKLRLNQWRGEEKVEFMIEDISLS